MPPVFELPRSKPKPRTHAPGSGGVLIREAVLPQELLEKQSAVAVVLKSAVLVELQSTLAVVLLPVCKFPKSKPKPRTHAPGSGGVRIREAEALSHTNRHTLSLSLSLSLQTTNARTRKRQSSHTGSGSPCEVVPSLDSGHRSSALSPSLVLSLTHTHSFSLSKPQTHAPGSGRVLIREAVAVSLTYRDTHSPYLSLSLSLSLSKGQPHAPESGGVLIREAVLAVRGSNDKSSEMASVYDLAREWRFNRKRQSSHTGSSTTARTSGAAISCPLSSPGLPLPAGDFDQESGRNVGQEKNLPSSDFPIVEVFSNCARVGALHHLLNVTYFHRLANPLFAAACVRTVAGRFSTSKPGPGLGLGCVTCAIFAFRAG